MDKIQLIIEEIERRQEDLESRNFHSMVREYDDFYSFINSLPGELSHSEVTKTCPRYDQEAVSEDFEEEVDAFWHDGISQEQDEVEGVLNKTVTIEKLTRVRFVYYDDDGNEYHVIERDMNTVPNVGDELYLDSDDVDVDLDGWCVKSRVCDLGRNLWRLSISHRNDEINGHIWKFKEE